MASFGKEVDHIARLAECQREWLMSAKCTSSDSDDTGINNRCKRLQKLTADMSIHSRRRKVGVALKRRPREISKSSSSSYDSDDVNDDEPIAACRMDACCRSSEVCGQSDPIQNETSCQKSGNMMKPVRRRDVRLGHSSDESGVGIEKSHLIVIGTSSFDRYSITAVLGDSIKFVLVDLEESSLLGELVLKGTYACSTFLLHQCIAVKKFHFDSHGRGI